MSVNLKKMLLLETKKALVTYINRKMICKIKLRNIFLSSKPCFLRREVGVRAYVRGRTCDVAIIYVLGTHILQSDCIYLDCDSTAAVG